MFTDPVVSRTIPLSTEARPDLTKTDFRRNKKIGKPTLGMSFAATPKVILLAALFLCFAEITRSGVPQTAPRKPVQERAGRPSQPGESSGSVDPFGQGFTRNPPNLEGL